MTILLTILSIVVIILGVFIIASMLPNDENPEEKFLRELRTVQVIKEDYKDMLNEIDSEYIKSKISELEEKEQIYKYLLGIR